MTHESRWHCLPLELRERDQWLLATPDAKGDLKVPTSIKDKSGKLCKGSVKEPETWLPFEIAVHWAQKLNLGLGYVLSKDDPYTCVDLDIKNENNEPDESEWTSQDVIERHGLIAQTLDSFTEASQSGQGYHIWVRAELGLGCKRDHVEIYSQERFIVCTGNTVHHVAIHERQDWIDKLAVEIRRGQRAEEKVLVESEELEDDQIIFDRASNASNGDKFRALCECTSTDPETGEVGSFYHLGYPSQSEADLALMSIFAFYSKSNEQCRRLFRMTGLGQRPKATKNNRILDLMLKEIRARQARDEVIQISAENLSAQFAKSISKPVLALVQKKSIPEKPTLKDLGWPPGLAGEIAKFIYGAAPRQVKEVAIVGALGFLAGIVGKAYNIPQSGLNVYIILVAKSAIGKEGMHTGISALLNAMDGLISNSRQYVDFNDFASGPALAKAVALQSSFVNIAGEWGHKLKRLADEHGRDSAMQQLRTVMTNLYQKSGAGNIVGGISYSDKEKNVSSSTGIAYSMIGETTPDTFYDSLTSSMMSDGFMSRFNIVEFTGDRPAANPEPNAVPNERMLQQICSLCNQAGALNTKGVPQQIVEDEFASVMFKKFDVECDAEINSTGDESYRQMWNRAHLKAKRIAGILAVGDNYLFPIISASHATYALDLIRRDISIMQKHLLQGDIGMSDNARQNKVASIIREYIEEPDTFKDDKLNDLQEHYIVPRRYLQQKTANVTSFREHRMQATAALDIIIKSMIDDGFLIECDKIKMIEEYSFHGKCYRVIKLPDSYMTKTVSVKNQ